ncbi:hypothetical protein ES703_97680 [subsurface metagenome]
MFTKGPWLVHEWVDKFQVVEAQIRIREKPGIIMTGQRIIAKEITRANANLIAQAPRMYEALKQYERIGIFEEFPTYLQGLRNILSKAEGN